MSPSDAARLVSAIEQLTLQVSRVAYAIEETSMDQGHPDAQACDTCRRCGCNLVPSDADKCPVCKEPYVWKDPDGLSGVETE